MKNFLKLFRKPTNVIAIKKAEKELLEYFIANKPAFDQWYIENQHPKIRFRFYFPTAIDFYFEEFKLFTAYFKKSSRDLLELQELKMSEANQTSIRTTDWRPFEEVILHFLTMLEENNKASWLHKRKSLYEYAAICEQMDMAAKEPRACPYPVNNKIAAA
jgi:hypothetical protein